MRFTFHNVGMVSKADINLEGLIVIAGENDTGKSTVGKLIYSIIRALSKYKEEFQDDRNELLMKYADKIYFELRRYIDLNEEIELRNMFRDFLREIIISRNEDVQSIISNVEDKKEIVQSLPLEPDQVNSILNIFNDILRLINLESEDINVKKQALQKGLMSEFDNDVNNHFINKPSDIKGRDGASDIFSLKVVNNKVDELSLNDEIFFNEAIYIESPYVLQMRKQLRYASPLRGSIIPRINRYISGLPLHTTDLLSQLQKDPIQDNSAEDILKNGLNIKDTINKIISKTIQGKFEYDSDKGEFLYKRVVNGQQQDVKLNNVATGIRSFGIIQMLMDIGALHERSLLIIDEPEVHLHPKWQVAYAEILVSLVKELNITILLNSHSPYFIEAIKVYSDQNKIGEKTKFYLSSKEESNLTSTIEDVTNNLDRIFDKLAEPFALLDEESVDDN